MQNILRPAIEELAGKMEFSIAEARPGLSFWNDFDKETFVQQALEKHVAADDNQHEE